MFFCTTHDSSSTMEELHQQVCFKPLCGWCLSIAHCGREHHEPTAQPSQLLRMLPGKNAVVHCSPLTTATFCFLLDWLQASSMLQKKTRPLQVTSKAQSSALLSHLVLLIAQKGLQADAHGTAKDSSNSAKF